VLTAEYAPGRLLDVHGEGDAGVVLLWHGRGAHSRSDVAGLAGAVASHGRQVAVPDWDCDERDGGRSALEASLRYAYRRAERIGLDPREVVLVGWSLGGTAAVGLVTGDSNPPVRRAVLLSPGDGPRAVDPFSGHPLPAAFPDGTGRARIDLVSGSRDTIATPELVHGLEARLRAVGWQTTFTEVDADHGSMVLGEQDESSGDFVPGSDSHSLEVGRRIAAIVVGIQS
jgi:dienelactone hydrolase